MEEQWEKFKQEMDWLMQKLQKAEDDASRVQTEYENDKR